MKLNFSKIPHQFDAIVRDEDGKIAGVKISIQIVGIISPKEIPSTYRFQSTLFKLTNYKIELHMPDKITFLSVTYTK